jgi:hypothetical protein
VRNDTHTHTHTYIYIYIYIHVVRRQTVKSESTAAASQWVGN